MSMRKKCIPLLITAASSVLVACASNHSAPLIVATHPPMVVDNYHTPSAAELYAQRYPSSVMQVAAGDQRRFVMCENDCSGATPKTSIANLNAAVARRAQDNRHTRTRSDSEAEKAVAAHQTLAQVEALDAGSQALTATAVRLTAPLVVRAAVSDASKASASDEQTIQEAGREPPSDPVARMPRDTAKQEPADDAGELQ